MHHFARAMSTDEEFDLDDGTTLQCDWLHFKERPTELAVSDGGDQPLHRVKGSNDLLAISSAHDLAIVGTAQGTRLRGARFLPRPAA